MDLIRKLSADDPVRSLHTKIIFPDNISVSNGSGQTAHCDLVFLDRSHHVNMSEFFELVSVALYGGVRNKRFHVPNSTDPSIGALRLVKPDIYDLTNKSIREAKSNKNTQEVNILDEQINRYEDLLRLTKDFTYTFEIYRHSFQRIKSWRGSSKELFSLLGQSTDYALRLPFSVVHKIWGLRNISGGEKYVREYTPPKEDIGRKFDLPLFGHENGEQVLIDRKSRKSYPQCTCVRSETLVEIMRNPTGILSDLGLNPNDYVIERTSSPPNLSVQGSRVLPFPILNIKEQ